MMTNWKGFAEGDKLTQEYILNQPEDKRIGVIVEKGSATGQYGTYPKLKVDINGSIKYWNVNQQSAVELGGSWGWDDDGWIGKKVVFGIGRNSKNQPLLVGKPYTKE